MSERFFTSKLITADRATLDGPEAHHLLHVMRARVGQEVTLFDGSGTEFTAVVESLRRSEAELHVTERRVVNRELRFTLALGVALPKGDRQKWLVEKLTELGVTTLVPIETERGVAQPAASALDRLRRSVIEAAKQCGRNRLMQIAEPVQWSDWLAEDFGSRIADCGIADQSAIQNPQSEIQRLVAHPGGAKVTSFDFHQSHAILSIGPEGGLTDLEIQAARQRGWQTVDLGPRILRVETAAIALAAAFALR